MKRLLTTLLFIATTLGLPAFGADKSSPADAVAMVNKAAAYMKANGAAKTLAEASNPTGQFVRQDLYLSIYDLDGKVVAHGSNKKLIGVDVSKLKDADDKPFMQDILSKAKSEGKGTVDYKWVNPVSKEIQAKSTYFAKVGEFIIACGIYK